MIKIIVDSTFCVKEDYAKKHDITVVNLTTLLDGVSRPEGYEPEWKEFFEALKKTKDFPKTSQPSPELFQKLYTDLLKDSKNEVLVMTLSESLSGTVNSAKLARESLTEGKDRVFVVDSTQTCLSSLLLLEAVVEKLEQEPNITGKEIEQFCHETTPKIAIEFVPLTMEYLKRGGRIGLLSATFATVFNIKPLLLFKEGVLTCAKKIFGMANAMDEMIRSVPENIKKIYVSYIDSSNVLETFKNKVYSVFQDKDVQLDIAGIGPVVGSHIGPGAIGLAYITK